MKIRDLKRILHSRGYHVRPGHGSHSVWTHPAMPEKPIVLHGNANDDAHPYLIARVCQGKRSARCGQTQRQFRHTQTKKRRTRA